MNQASFPRLLRLNGPTKMNRTELGEKIRYMLDELKWLQDIEPNCHRCLHCTVAESKCAKFGEIPPDFMAHGCDNWEYDLVPF